MATFTWSAGSTGDWNNTSDWTLTGGSGTAPPGSTGAATDIATLDATRSSYTVLINAGEQYDINALNIAGQALNNVTSLEISGSLLTDTLSYSGGANESDILLAGGLLDIRTSLTSTALATMTIAGGTLELGSATNSGININDTKVTFSFNGVAGGAIEFNGPAFTTGDTAEQTITDAIAGDEFVFDHANFSGDTFGYAGTSNKLTVTNSSGDTVLTMTNLSGRDLTSESFVGVDDTIQIQAVCFSAGTRIQTPIGERVVESLAPGDMVFTLADGQLIPQPVKWVGKRRIELTAHLRPETVAPIRIAPDAFADRMPHRDLMISPDHAVFVDGKLICARQLVNGSTIRHERNWTAVDYYHVELDKHAILLAEGLPAESYIDTGNSAFFDNSDAPLELHPDLTDQASYPTREERSCAPFVWDEANVRPVWQRLADRAAIIGQPVPRWTTTTEANLFLFYEHYERKPVYSDSNLVIFLVPRGAKEVRLTSRAQSPTEARPWLDDRRRLGVRVKRMVLRSANELREIAMDHPGLDKGWWDIERDGQAMSRWTNGDAILPMPPVAGHVILEIHLAGAMTFLVGTAPERRVA
jgi:hypothetical protein